MTSDRSNRFLRACRGESVDTTPVWFMRQAGRYMPEYRKIRETASLLEICHDPALCTEVTLQPVEAIGVDAAILFADILLPLEPMGAPFHFAKGEGPVIEKPVANAADVKRLRALKNAEGLEYVMDDIRAVKLALGGKVPLIGFAGGPFTLASYLIEGGGGDRTFAKTKALMYSDPRSWHSLMAKLATTVAAYLGAQVDAGADAVQLFDSWVGCLSPDDYRDHVAPWSNAALSIVTGRVPVIHFGVDTATLLPAISEAGGDVIGVDWRLPMDRARVLVPKKPLQGNLDPLALLGPWKTIEKKSQAILDAMKGRPHIFNVGHGLTPATDPAIARDLVAWVHEHGAATSRAPSHGRARPRAPRPARARSRRSR